MLSFIVAGEQQNIIENKNERDDTYLFRKKWSNEFSFTQIPNALIYCQGHLGLTDRELIIILQLTSHWFRYDKNPYPGITKLGVYSGKCYSTVQRSLMNLEEKGFLSREERPGTSNAYDLTPCVYKLQDHIKVCPNTKSEVS